MATIFVRERGQVGRGAGRPRFVIVAVANLDLKIYTPHIRKSELEKLAEIVGAEVVFLPRGEKAGQEEDEYEGRKSRRRAHRQAGNG